jgi:predicted transcriptional regulator
MPRSSDSPRARRLGDLQLAILRRLWQRGEAAVADVHADLLESRGLATTTIATMLAKMEKKGVVTHRVDGRRYIYRPTVSEKQVRQGMVSEIKDRLFQGDPVALVSHLLTEHEVDSGEIAELKNLIARHERKENT